MSKRAEPVLWRALEVAAIAMAILGWLWALRPLRHEADALRARPAVVRGAGEPDVEPQRPLALTTSIWPVAERPSRPAEPEVLRKEAVRPPVELIGIVENGLGGGTRAVIYDGRSDEIRVMHAGSEHGGVRVRRILRRVVEIEFDGVPCELLLAAPAGAREGAP